MNSDDDMEDTSPTEQKPLGGLTFKGQQTANKKPPQSMVIDP